MVSFAKFLGVRNPCIFLVQFRSPKVQKVRNTRKTESPKFFPKRMALESTDDWKRETHPINEINQQNATSIINEASQQNEANPKTVTNQKSQQISDNVEIKAEYEDFSTIDHDHAYQAIPDSEEDLEELFLQLENNVNTLKNSNRLDNRNSHDNINNNGDNLVEELDVHIEDHELGVEDHDPNMEDQQPALDEIEPDIEVEVLELNATIG